MVLLYVLLFSFIFLFASTIAFVSSVDHMLPFLSAMTISFVVHIRSFSEYRFHPYLLRFHDSHHYLYLLPIPLEFLSDALILLFPVAYRNSISSHQKYDVTNTTLLLATTR